ncbi:MAG: hypothetical protein J7641_22000 [Cyanobacteria bacterium SID2]|nr:hypothetical protein [Cyanobacteria bacterium SID2]
MTSIHRIEDKLPSQHKKPPGSEKMPACFNHLNYRVTPSDSGTYQPSSVDFFRNLRYVTVVDTNFSIVDIEPLCD